MSDEKSHKNTPKYTLPEKVINTGQKTLNSIDDILGEDFVIENSFFWIFQKWIWAILKMLFVIGIIVFFVWIIWLPNEDLKKRRIIIPEKIISKIKIETPSISKTAPSATTSTKDIILATEWNNRIKEAQMDKLKNLPAEGIYWIKKANAFFDVPTALLVNGKTSQIRQKKIEDTLVEMEKSLEKSKKLKKLFGEQINNFLQNIKKEEAIAKQAGKDVTTASLEKNVFNAEQNLSEKIVAEQRIVNLTNKMKWYKTVFFEIEKYDRVLQAFQENLIANKEALIQNIQVVDFPNDPFSRTLTPAEWRKIERK